MARAGVSLFVVLTCVILLAAMVIARSAHSPSGRLLASASPSPANIPAGAVIYDADLIDRTHGWLLFRTCDPASGVAAKPPASSSRVISPQQAAVCQYSIARTTDGGVSWSKAGDVGRTYASVNGGAPRLIHFLNAADGFAYGEKGGFVTHDGGDTWTDGGFSFGLLLSIAGRGRIAWAVSEGQVAGELVPAVQRSADGGRTWSPARPLQPEAGYGWPKAVAFGVNGLVVWGWTVADITYDDGATWTSISTPCTGSLSPDTSVIATADGHELWSACVALVQAGPPKLTAAADVVLSGMFVSEDGGATWSERSRPDPTLLPGGGDGGTGSRHNFPGSFMATGKGSAIINTWGGSIFATHDGGLTWREVGPTESERPNGWGFLDLRLGSPTDVWAIESGNLWLWASHDGGQTWSPLGNPATGSAPA